jgi:tRNA A-37 threonylcarbamoyl transferase component Bud32/tetratricopeptide (TPR) repeat protein
MSPGDRYGRYQIVRILGRGAMGEVYLAVDTESTRQVALKLVYKGADAEDQEILEAERVGAELQKRVAGADPRVVAVNRYGEIDGDLFIEMEYIEGEDLSALLTRGPLTPGFASYVAMELCEMLENLRAFATTVADREFEGVIHGDLKPKNIRINTRNEVKVLDFGIAKAISQTRKFTLNVFASAAYCSPERLETHQMDVASDLWSVGVLLYQMVTGKLPFEESTKERLERRIRSYQPPDPPPASCPEPLARIMLKMLARDPARRYQSPVEAKQDLARFRQGEPIHAEVFESDATVRTAPAQREDAAGDATTRTSVRWPEPVRAAPRSYNSMGCLAAVGVTVLLTGVIAWAQMNFWNDADQLKTDLQAERVSNLEEPWTRYQGLTKKAHLSFMLWGAKKALKKRLVAAAEETILEYRNNDSTTVYENQWAQAKNNLARALELDPDDNGVKGRLRLCEGHLDRISAQSLKNGARQKRLYAAAAKFQEAADLLKTPDPYLGLARVYIYDLNDMEKAEEALEKAGHRGHSMGRRERAQLGDGYLRRADRLSKESRGLTQSPSQERDYLDRARQDYIRAQDLYQQAGLFGDAARNQMRAMQAQQKVEQRLSEMQGGTGTL